MKFPFSIQNFHTEQQSVGNNLLDYTYWRRIRPNLAKKEFQIIQRSGQGRPAYDCKQESTFDHSSRRVSFA